MAATRSRRLSRPDGTEIAGAIASYAVARLEADLGEHLPASGLEDGATRWRVVLPLARSLYLWFAPLRAFAGAPIVSRSLYRATLPLRFSSNLSNRSDVGCILHGSVTLAALRARPKMLAWLSSPQKVCGVSTWQTWRVCIAARLCPAVIPNARWCSTMAPRSAAWL